MALIHDEGTCNIVICYRKKKVLKSGKSFLSQSIWSSINTLLLVTLCSFGSYSCLQNTEGKICVELLANVCCDCNFNDRKNAKAISAR